MKILLIEDTVEEAEFAMEALKVHQLSLATDYAGFQEQLKLQPELVLSDLYFPYGAIEENLKQRFRKETLNRFDTFISTHHQTNPIAEAIEVIFKTGVFGNTLDNYFSAMKNDPIVQMPKFQEQIRDKWNEYQTNKTYCLLREEMNLDQHLLPLGLFVSEECQKQNIPCVIVTSEYHHGVKFQPFSNSAGPYFDRLTDGHKQWQEAVQRSMQNR